MQGNDVRLPWQYAVLGFYTFGAIFAILFIVTSVSPPAGMQRTDPVMAYSVGIPYLCVGLIAGPWLIRSGRRTVREWKQKEPADRSTDGVTRYAALGQPVPTEGRNARVAALACAILWIIAVLSLVAGNLSQAARAKCIFFVIAMPVAIMYILVRGRITK